LDIYKEYLQSIYTDKENRIALMSEDDSHVMVGGVISRTREILTKNDDKMAFITISYYGKDYEVVVFPKMWDKSKFKIGKAMVVEGKKQPDRGNSIVLDNYADLVINSKGKVVLK
jgi:DNA polymerase-3 subunit alpha